MPKGKPLRPVPGCWYTVGRNQDGFPIRVPPVMLDLPPARTMGWEYIGGNDLEDLEEEED